jgi:Mg2+-importing ATPase
LAAEIDLEVEIPLDDAALLEAKNSYRVLESKGFRILGVAFRRCQDDVSTALIDEHEHFVFVGFIAFSDPPKLSAGKTLQALEKLGVTIKIITGDSELVTRNICTQLGFHEQGMLLGHEINNIDDFALQAQVEHINLFCRMSPVQKTRIIRALKYKGHVVGYLGDGINDVPSINAADVGMSVDLGVDSAKAAADMILLKHDLGILQEAVIEGRRTFGNIMKYIMMSTSSNFGNMLSMAAAVTFLPFLPMLPTQILLNNILYDISEVAIPFDKIDDIDIEQPRVLDIRLIQRFMLTMGPISSVFDIITFYFMLEVFTLSESLFQTGWFIESLCTQVLVIFVIRTRKRFWRSHPHPALIATSLAVVLLAIVIPLTPWASYFGMTTPPLVFYVFLALMTISYLTVVEFVKTKFFKEKIT